MHLEKLKCVSQVKINQLCQGGPRYLVPEISVTEKLNDEACRSACRFDVGEKRFVRFEPVEQLRHLSSKPLICHCALDTMPPSRVGIVSRQKSPLRRLPAVA